MSGREIAAVVTGAAGLVTGGGTAYFQHEEASVALDTMQEQVTSCTEGVERQAKSYQEELARRDGMVQQFLDHMARAH